MKMKWQKLMMGALMVSPLVLLPTTHEAAAEKRRPSTPSRIWRGVLQQPSKRQFPPFVSRILLSRDGSTLVSHDNNQTEIWVWNLSRRRLQHQWKFDSFNELLSLAPDGKLLALRQQSRTRWKFGDSGLDFWRLEASKPRRVWSRGLTPGRWFQSVRIAQDVQILEMPWLETRGRDGKLKRKVRLQGKFEGGSFEGAFSADGRLVAASVGQEIRLFETRSGRLWKIWKSPADFDIPFNIRTVSFAPTGRFLYAFIRHIAQTPDGMEWEGSSYFNIWNAQTGKPPRVETGKSLQTLVEQRESLPLFSPDGQATLSSSLPSLQFRDLTTGQITFRAPLPFGDENSRRGLAVQFSGDGRTMAATNQTGQVWIHKRF